MLIFVIVFFVHQIYMYLNLFIIAIIAIVRLKFCFLLTLLEHIQKYPQNSALTPKRGP